MIMMIVVAATSAGAGAIVELVVVGVTKQK